MRWRWMSPVSSRYGGFGVGWPSEVSVWEEKVALQGFCGSSQSVPLGSGGPTTTPLIHERVKTRVKTHCLTLHYTLARVGVDETGYFVGLW